MMKPFFLLFLLLVSFSCFAATTCPQALPTNDPNFCASFKDAAVCNCLAKGLPHNLCGDLKELYGRLITIFDTVDKMCHFQKETSHQTCVNDWTCYMQGGKDADGSVCSSTGHACI